MRIFTKFSLAKKPLNFLALLLPLLAGAVLLSLLCGASGVSLWQGMTDCLRGADTAASRILMYIRLPRTVASAAAGAALACAGVLIQGVLGNPLAGPNIIGVNAGAGFAVLLICCLVPAATPFLPAAAFVGALLASLFILTLADKTGASKLTLLLAGVTVSAILSAVCDFFRTFAPESVLNMSDFLIGGFNGITWQRLNGGLILILPALLAAVLLYRALDLMSLGEETAAALGLNVRSMRLILLGIASVLAGASVSFSGLLGFVGLLVPHLVRRIVSTEHRYLLPFSMLTGAAFVILCDTAARTLFAPYELPVGILLSLLGGPFFLYLLLHHRKGGRA